MRSRRSAALIAVAAFTIGCSRSGDGAARKFLARGEAYLAQGQLNAATIELRNAVKAKPDFADAHFALGNAYEKSGDAAKAYASFRTAAEIAPSHVEGQLKAGGILLMAGDYQGARVHAERAVSAAPGNASAHILLGSALAGLKETGRAIEQIEQAITLDPEHAPAWTALGGVTLQKGDRERAGEAFREAVRVAPRSPQAHVALANYLWVTGDTAGAEATLRSAYAIDASNPLVHRALAMLLLVTRREREAEPHFKALAVGPAGKVALANYYLALGRKTEARGLIDAVLQEHQQTAYAHVAMARLVALDGGAPAEIERHAREALQLDPDLLAAQYLLGVAAMRRHDIPAAESAFRTVLERNPRAGAAQIHLAKLQLAQGDPGKAIEIVDRLNDDVPATLDAALVLVRSLRAQGDVVRAERELSSALAKAPAETLLLVEQGHLALQRRDTAAARRARDAARQTGNAVHTVAMLSAHIEAAEGRPAEAERLLRGVVSADASQLEAYELLGRLYIAQGHVDRALVEYRALADRSPSPSAPLTMVAILHESRGENDLARAQYEAVLAANPRSGVAANNLAWIYAESGRFDEAISLATVARDELRRRPEGEDTLGWALLKKDRVQEAIGAFERAVARAPRKATYLYHLGLAHARAGNTERARRALTQALALGDAFPGAADAKSVLAGLRP